MIRRPEELTESIREAVDHRAVLYSHILLALVIASHTALDPTSTRTEVVLAIVLSSLLVLLSIFRVFDLARVNKFPRFYLIVYQLFCIFGLSFVADAATPYAVGVFMVVFISNLYYGSKGVWLTVACFGIMTVIKYIYWQLTQDATVIDELNIVATFFIFVSVCSLFVNIQKVYDWDRSRLKETIKKEALEQKRLRALINNMTESVLVLDKEGVIKQYNAAALSILNTNASLTDKELDDLAQFENEKGVKIATKDLLPKDNRPIVRDDLLIRYGQDDVAAISVVSTLIRATFGEEDSEEGYVVTMRDVTKEKSLEEERNEFISVISHELRTPVTVVEAGISNAMLQAEKLKGGEKAVESLRTSHEQSLFLANMLNDLSTFARAEKGTLEMDLESFNPKDLIEALADDYSHEATAKNLRVVSKSDTGTPEAIVSNRLYVREILQNFVTNAIKYSDQGVITIRVKPKHGGVVFSVTDEGIGISVSDQKKVFDKFFRAEDFRTRSTSGTGLGLYITKKLAKLLDATFDLESEVGKGSTFSVYIPDKSDILAAKHKTQPTVSAAL